MIAFLYKLTERGGRGGVGIYFFLQLIQQPGDIFICICIYVCVGI